MIIPPSFFLILAILPTITEQVATYYSEKSLIDWSECKKYTRCFCLNDAAVLVEERDDIAKQPTPQEPDVGRCNIGVQHRFFTTQTAVFQFQVLEDTNELGVDPQLMLYQGTVPIFGCKLDSKTGKIELVADEVMKKMFRASLFEDRSRFEKGRVLCAIKAERANKALDTVKNHPTTANTHTNIRLSVQSNEHKFKYPDFNLFSPTTTLEYRCNPYSFNDLSVSAEYSVSPLINRDKPILNCDNYGSYYTMRYENKNKDSGEMQKLECKQDTDPKKYYYTQFKGENGADEQKIKKPEEYTFYCAAQADVLCKDPNTCDPSTDPKCPVFTEGAGADAATLKCANNKWLIEDEYYVLEEEVVCKKDSISGSREVKFFIKPPSSPEKVVPKLDKAQCFTEYDCMKKSKLFFVGCDDDIDKCTTIAYKDGIVKCRNETIDLVITADMSNITARSLTCDKSTGLWKKGAEGSQDTIAANSQVECFEQQEYSEFAQADMSNSQITWIIVGTLLGFLVFFVLIGILVHLYTKRKLLFGTMGKEAWLKMSKIERVAHCKQTLGDVMKATTATEFKHGLRLIEIILDTENADTEIWDEVYPFLSRFLATIQRQDHHCWHMFTRYLYLCAKKIIDKHGWLTKKPISRTNQSGLIRVVAIRLLGLCLTDNRTEETEKLLLKGYRKLGFKGRSQYPHCGVMWATIVHVFPSSFVRSGVFDYTKFMASLRRIAFRSKTPQPDDAIPAFGNCSQQAAYAIGGFWSPVYHTKNGRPHVLRKDIQGGAVSMSYFLGICDSLTRNPSQFLVEMCKTQKPDPAFLAALHKVHSQLEWNTKILRLFRIVTYLGRYMDTKMLERRFMPAVAAPADTPNAPPKPNEYLTELYTEQEHYEKAMDEQLEDLREFFTPHMDKKELKETPVYITSGKVKLDSRVNTGKTKDVEAGPNAKSCGGSEKSGSEAKSDVKSDAKAGGPSSNPEPPKSNDGKQEPSAPEAPAATPSTPASDPAAPGEPPAAKGPPASDPAAAP